MTKSEVTEKKSSLHELELLIAYFLRWGVLGAGILLLVGWLWMLSQEGDVLGQYKDYQPVDLIESLHWALIMNNKAYLTALAGLVLLVLLPVIRVFLAGVLFIKDREYRMAAMALAVFVALVTSFFLGIDL